MPTLPISRSSFLMIADEKLTGTSSPSFLTRVKRKAVSFPGGPYSLLRISRMISLATSVL